MYASHTFIHIHFFLGDWHHHIFPDFRSQDVISFSAVISSCEKSSQWTQALHFFGLMREHRIPANVVSFSGFEVEVLQSSRDVPSFFRIQQTWVHEKSIVICFDRESKAIVLWSVRLRRLGSGNWDCRCFQSWMVTSSRMSSATVQQSVHVRKQESGSWLCCCHSPDVFRGTCHGSFWLRSEILSCWGSLPSSCQLQRETGGVHCWLSHHPLFWATGWTHQEVETVLNWQQFLHFQTWYQKQSHFLSILGLPDSAILSAKSFEPIFSLCLSSWVPHHVFLKHKNRSKSQGLRTCQVPRSFPTSSASIPPSLPVRRATSGCWPSTSSTAPAGPRCVRTSSAIARFSQPAQRRASGVGPWRSMVGWRGRPWRCGWMWSPAMQLGLELDFLGMQLVIPTNQWKCWWV